MTEQIKNIIQYSIKIKQKLLSKDSLQAIKDVADICIDSINAGGTIYFCGNGGSAADAQHLAAELLGKFYKDRRPLPAACLHTNTSYVTAVANDYGYEHVYARIIQCIGKPGDVLFGISTSGKSKNVINAFKEARENNVYTIGLTGDNNNFNSICDNVIKVPSNDTPRIQECHITIGHIICQLIEENI